MMILYFVIYDFWHHQLKNLKDNKSAIFIVQNNQSNNI